MSQELEHIFAEATSETAAAIVVAIALLNVQHLASPIAPLLATHVVDLNAAWKVRENICQKDSPEGLNAARI